MAIPKQIFILTFVLGLSSVWAAPHNLDPSKGGAAPTEAGEDLTDEMNTVTVSEVPDTGPTKRVLSDGYFYRYQSSLSPRIGYLWDPKAAGAVYLLGFGFMADSLTNRHWEIGADLFSNSKGMFHGGLRWIFSSSNPFRPFFKLGMGLLMEPGDGLGNFLSFSHYQARLGGGFEKLIRDPMSLRFDAELGVGSGGVQGALILGYSWAW